MEAAAPATMPAETGQTGGIVDPQGACMDSGYLHHGVGEAQHDERDVLDSTPLRLLFELFLMGYLVLEHPFELRPVGLRDQVATSLYLFMTELSFLSRNLLANVVPNSTLMRMER